MARIRTIKPEFWQNETLASLSEHARLLAIALLNHSDDKGYFLANAALVRAACFPFEEHSKNVLGSLRELSRIGYIEVRNCGGKHIGLVVKFTEHQRIDKAQNSKLEAIFNETPKENDDSKNVPGSFQEHSWNDPRLERKGTGNREEEKEMEKEQIVGADAPVSLSPNEVAEAKNKKTRSKFIPPTIDEIKEEIALKGMSVDAEEFEAYYAAQGWKKANGLLVQDWKKALVTWKTNRSSQHVTLKTFTQQKTENTQKVFDAVFGEATNNG